MMGLLLPSADLVGEMEAFPSPLGAISSNIITSKAFMVGFVVLVVEHAFRASLQLENSIRRKMVTRRTTAPLHLTFP